LSFKSRPTESALSRIVAEGFEAVLLPAGFESTQRKLTWARPSRELHHIVTVLRKRQLYDVQWGVFATGAAEIIWGVPSDPSDVGQAVLSGTPGTIRHPAPGQSWRLDSSTDQAATEAIADAVRSDMQVVASRLAAFETRHDVRTYLLLNRDPIDRRDFVIPANLPLKLLTAATLAVLDRDKAVCDLVSEVEAQWTRYPSESTKGRLTRLRTATDAICT
jgi:hypothetical protein